MSRIEEIADNVLVLTDIVPVDDRLSWVAPGSGGFEPHNKFLILKPDTALLIDTGFQLHGPALVKTLERVVGHRQLVVFATRSEPVCIANVPLILQAFPSTQMVTTSALNPARIVHLLDGLRSENVASKRMKIGDYLTEFGFSQVSLLDPPVRLLGTSWLHDGESGTLFTSDFFAAELLKEETDSVIRRDRIEFPTIADLRAGILAKFEWLARAEIAPVAKRWDALFEKIQPAAIAPGQGRCTAGNDVVAHVLGAYKAASFDQECAL